MSETPETKTFDLAAVLEGRDYPEKTVDVFFDESLGLAISEANNILEGLAEKGDTAAYKDAEKKFEDLLKTADKHRYRVLLRGVPRKVKKDILTRLMAEYPKDKNIFDMQSFTPEKEEFYATLLWESYVVNITDPSGATSGKPNADDIRTFRSYAPQSAVNTIEQGIQDLENEVSSGFEVMARSADFLSKP